MDCDCYAVLEIPADLLTDDEKQKGQFKLAESWIGSMPNRLSATWEDTGKAMLKVTFQPNETSHLGQFINMAYNHFGAIKTWPKDHGPLRWNVTAHYSGAITAVGKSA